MTLRRDSVAVRRAEPLQYASIATLALAFCLGATGAAAQVATGSYAGDGSAARSVTGLGFTPAVVVIKGDLAAPAIIRTNAMPLGRAKPLTLEQAPVTDHILALIADGFVVGDAAAVNQAGAQYRYIAFAEQVGGMVACGTYLGDGTADREILGLGLTPGLVLLIPGNDARCRLRTDVMPAGMSLAFDDVALEENVLIALTGGGFRVGDSWQANELGTPYGYVAISRDAERSFFGAYTGNGTTNRVINDAGFRPQWVVIQSAESRPGAHQIPQFAGAGRTLGFRPEPDFVEGIKQFTGQGFAIGNHERVNEAGKTFYFAAFASGGETADLAVLLGADAASRELGETFSLSAGMRNDGSVAVADAVLQVEVPPGLTLRSFAPDPGLVGDYSTPEQIRVSYDLAAGEQRQVVATYVVASGPALRTFDAAIVGSSRPDPNPANNAANWTIDVLSADLALTVAVDDPQPAAGATVSVTTTLANLGPDGALAPAVTVELPAGISLVEASPGAGTYDVSSGTWLPGPLAAAGQTALLLVCTVAADLAGQQRSIAAAVVDPRNDPVAANNTAAATLTIAEAAIVSAAVVPFAQEHRRLLPGGPTADVLHVRLHHHGAQATTLASVSFTNPVTNGRGQAEQDALWSAVELRTADGATVATGLFEAGRFTAADLALALPGGGTLDLVLRGSAALTAPDGVLLQPALPGGEDLTFSAPLTLQGAWPLTAPGTLRIDGMTAAQIILHPVGPEAFQMGSVRNLALDVVVPSNGGQPDVLTKLNVVNLGNAAPGSVLTRVEAWADDSNGIFNPAVDQRIGQLYWTGGDRYEASALSVPIPVAGLRVFVTVDVAADAIGGTIRLSLPAGDDVAINVASGNDGPIDEPVANPFTQTITATDRVIVTTAPVASRVVSPGEDRVLLLHLVARNLYGHAQTLRQLRVHNLARGAAAATRADLDGTANQLFLRFDGNGNGQFDDPDSDPVAATAVWQDGVAVFEGVRWELPPGAVVHLFMTANLSLFGCADGDTLGAAIGAAGDLQFREEAALVGAWPLDSGARHRVRGMVAAQVLCPEVPPISLAAGEGPALALDFTVPANGYLDDTLQSLRLRNLGTAGSADIAALSLWADDGDGLFDPATDQWLGDMTSVAQDWLALDFGLAVPAGGRRLFAGLTITSTPVDSATVRLAVPVAGLTMQSSNDGPRDGPVTSPTTLLISTAPLLSSFSFERPRSTTDMTVPLAMRVTNVGGEQIDGITPAALAFSGSGAVVLIGGPVPASLDLAPGASGTFAWTLAAETAGSFQAIGNCTGVGAVGGQTRSSLNNASAVHRILEPASDLRLYPVANMPFSINRGQTGVVPLTLTLLNHGGEERSEIRLERLVVTLDDGEGGPIAPADLLRRAVVNEGVLVYCDKTQPEATGQTLALDLSPAVIVTAREPVTLGLRLDIRPDPQAQRFRVGLPAAAALTATDAISGLPRGIELTAGDFPVLSATGTIVAQATGLLVAGVPLADGTAGAGQPDVELLRLALSSQGDDLSSEVKVGAFAVSLRDDLDRPLADASAHLSRLWVQGPLTVHSLREITNPADSLVVFELMPQITVPVGAPPLHVSVRAQIAASPMLGPLRLRLAGPQRFDARDGNISTAVPITYETAPLTGPVIALQAPTPAIVAAVEPRLPAQIALGSRDVTALYLRLEHQGPSSAGAARLDTLRLDCLDGARRPLDPRLVLAACRLNLDGTWLAAPAAFQADRIAIPLGGRLLAAGDQADLVLRIDVAAATAIDAFELILGETDLAAVDANLLSPVAMAAAADQRLPGSSGVARLQPASVEVVAGWLDRLSPLLPDGETTIEAAHLVLTNPAPAGAAPLELASLRVRASGRDGSALAAGAVLGRVVATIADTIWSEAIAAGGEDSTLVLIGAEPWLLPAASSRTVVLHIAGRPGATHGGVRIGLDAADLLCRQPGGGAAALVRSASGQSFPFWTAPAGQGAADLAGSYLNYPNPFAAGREQTIFAFNLPRSGRVSLRIWTARGEPVITLLRDQDLAAGLHQDLAWNGLNGRSQAVQNGVYLAELTVDYDDGGRERFLRKVAVVR